MIVADCVPTFERSQEKVEKPRGPEFARIPLPAAARRRALRKAFLPPPPRSENPAGTAAGNPNVSAASASPCFPQQRAAHLIGGKLPLSYGLPVSTASGAASNQIKSANVPSIQKPSLSPSLFAIQKSCEDSCDWPMCMGCTGHHFSWRDVWWVWEFACLHQLGRDGAGDRGRESGLYACRKRDLHAGGFCYPHRQCSLFSP